jgi:hypothetical protein
VNAYGVVGAALTIAQHGFVKLHRDEWTWTVKLLGVTGRTIASCRFSESPDTTRSEEAPDCPEKPDLRTAPKPASGLQSRAIPAAEN